MLYLPEIHITEDQALPQRPLKSQNTLGGMSGFSLFDASMYVRGESNKHSLTLNNLATSRLVPSPRSTAPTIRFRRSDEYAMALLKAMSSTHSIENRCKYYFS
jgi:hypothetical protein